jgi:sortase A
VTSRHPERDNQVRVPIGIVLLVVGAIIIGTAFVLTTLSPRRAPTLTEIPIAVTVATSPGLAQAIIVTPTPLLSDGAPDGPVLLPQTPLDEPSLPSFAAAGEAPTEYQVQIAHQPERLVIPDLDIDAPVKSVGLAAIEENGQDFFQWQVPGGYEVGWHMTSAPLGQAGNTVLNGHNNIHGEVFRDLIDLEIGSEVIVYDAAQPYRYVVSQKEVVPENDQPLSVRLENARLIGSTEDERITLISCWPYLTNSQRVLVVAKPFNEVGS